MMSRIDARSQLHGDSDLEPGATEYIDNICGIEGYLFYTCGVGGGVVVANSRRI